jgi:kynurenine formamidase
MTYRLSHAPLVFMDRGHNRETIAWADDRLVFVCYDPDTLRTAGIQLCPLQHEGGWKKRLYPAHRALLRATRTLLRSVGRISADLPEVCFPRKLGGES